MEQNNFSYAERIIIGILMTVFLIGFVNASNWGPAELVKIQGNASTDYYCTGSYENGDCNAMFDNNWASGSRPGYGDTINMYFNLTKSIDPAYNSHLRVNDSTEIMAPYPGYNNTIIPGCYNYYPTKIKFRAYSEWWGSQALGCWDGVSTSGGIFPAGWKAVYASWLPSGKWVYEFHMLWALNYSTVNLTYPQTNYITNNPLVNFNCSARISSQLYQIEGTTLTNISLWTNYTGTWTINQTNIVSGLDASVSFNNTYPNDAQFSWACQAYSSDNDNGFSTTNNSLYVDTEAPTINITYPYGVLSSVFLGQNLTFNFTVTDNLVVDSCWYSYNSVTYKVNCSDNHTHVVLSTPTYIDFYSNDTAGNIGSFTRNWSYGILQNSITFNPTTYETSTETYVLNVTAGGPGSVSAIFVYNGVSYPSTMTNLGSNNYLFTNSLNLPLSDTVSYLFYWNITFNSLPFSSTIENQTVLPINFTICSGPVNTTYFNVSFRDEMTNLPMNGTMDTSTWSFSLGGNIFHNYIYSSLVEKPSYAFCFSPQYRSINSSYTFSSSASGYITRVSQGRSLILTNTTTDKIVYLISSAAAGPIIIQVLDTTSGNAISGARIIVSRDIFGTTVNVYDAFTDDSGALGVYLSSVVPYTITASRSDCGSNTKTITPVGSVTMNLNCASNVSKFVAKIDGISYQRGPLDGVVQCTGIPQTFSYYVKSVIHPLVAVKFELVDANTRSVVATNESNATTSWCNITSCMLTIDYTSYAGDNFVGRYYVNNGNGTNNTYVLLEGDSRWRCININKNNSQQSVAKFFDHFREFTNAWGSTNIRCSQYHVNDTCVAQAECKWVVTGNAAIGWNNFCMLKDDYNKAEFNKILIVFFMMVIVLFIMSRTTGYEMTNPGSFVLFMAVIIFILSYFQMFYFNGLTPWAFFDQYIYSFICLLLAGGYNLSIIRRYSA